MLESVDREARRLAERLVAGELLGAEALKRASAVLVGEVGEVMDFATVHAGGIDRALREIGRRLARDYPEADPFPLGVALSGRFQLHVQRLVELGEASPDLLEAIDVKGKTRVTGGGAHGV